MMELFYTEQRSTTFGLDTFVNDSEEDFASFLVEIRPSLHFSPTRQEQIFCQLHQGFIMFTKVADKYIKIKVLFF